MEVNLEKLKARANDVRYAVERIRIYTSLPDERFWEDERNLFATKYLLLQAMEALGSICVHVLAKKFQVPVATYAACFERLAEHKVIPEELSNKLRRMMPFRNILIHRYWEVDDKAVVQYARKDVNDLIEMVKAVWRFLGIAE